MLKYVHYDPEWQVIRWRLKGKWTTDKPYPILRNYLHEENITDQERSLRCFRIVNALNAVRMGFGGAYRDSSQDMQIIQFRDEVYALQTTLPPPQIENFGAFTRHVIAGIKTHWVSLQPVIADLQKRSLKRAHADSRPELDWFLSLCSKEAAQR